MRISSISSFIVLRISVGTADWIGKRPADLRNAIAAAGANDYPEFAAAAAQRVDPAGSRGHPQRARAMQPLQGLLFDLLDLDRCDISAACGFEERTGTRSLRHTPSTIGDTGNKRGSSTK
jgi:hypothetical protein